MEIKTIKITLLISLTGIFLLLTLSNLLQPKITLIQDISKSQLNNQIKIKGEIINIKNFQETDFQIISIKDKSGEIDITLNKISNLSNHQNITIIGKITEYKNTLQIQASKIEEG